MILQKDVPKLCVSTRIIMQNIPKQDGKSVCSLLDHKITESQNGRGWKGPLCVI